MSRRLKKVASKLIANGEWKSVTLILFFHIQLQPEKGNHQSTTKGRVLQKAQKENERLQRGRTIKNKDSNNNHDLMLYTNDSTNNRWLNLYKALILVGANPLIL